MPSPWLRDQIIDNLEALLTAGGFSDVYQWGYPTTPPESDEVIRIADEDQSYVGGYKTIEKTLEVVVSVTIEPKATEKLARAAAVDAMGRILDVIGSDRRLKNISGGSVPIVGILPTRDKIEIDNTDSAAPLATGFLYFDVIYESNTYEM